VSLAGLNGDVEDVTDSSGGGEHDTPEVHEQCRQEICFEKYDEKEKGFLFREAELSEGLGKEPLQTS